LVLRVAFLIPSFGDSYILFIASVIASQPLNCIRALMMPADITSIAFEIDVVYWTKNELFYF
jgi:hypothetical protein